MHYLSGYTRAVKACRGSVELVACAAAGDERRGGLHVHAHKAHEQTLHTQKTRDIVAKYT